ncbi:MAG: NAD(+)/NADH kinase [Chloroflexi bacterium]|nr:NAD(+)/NADH kinase [Chloroflexota bacterium]
MVLGKIGILYHPFNKAACTLAKEVSQFLIARGVSAWLCSSWEGESARAQIDGTELLLSVGGDGTILRAAQVALLSKTPITGVNLGKLGFMTELSADEVMARLPALLAGEGWIDERAMLETELTPAQPGTELPPKYYALNDVVVARGAIARVVNIEAEVDGELLATYRADGMIAATATGSTGYSLAAGGPVLHPQSDEFLLLPVLPHLSLAYTMVLASTAKVSLRVSTTYQATLSIDGNMNLPLDSGTVINIKHSNMTTRFLRIHPRTSFYGTLEQRLKGKRDIE